MDIRYFVERIVYEKAVKEPGRTYLREFHHTFLELFTEDFIIPPEIQDLELERRETAEEMEELSPNDPAYKNVAEVGAFLYKEEHELFYKANQDHFDDICEKYRVFVKQQRV